MLLMAWGFVQTLSPPGSGRCFRGIELNYPFTTRGAVRDLYLSPLLRSSVSRPQWQPRSRLALWLFCIFCTDVWCVNWAREVCQTGFAWINSSTELESGQAFIMQANDQDFFFCCHGACTSLCTRISERDFKLKKREKGFSRRAVGFQQELKRLEIEGFYPANKADTNTGKSRVFMR